MTAEATLTPDPLGDASYLHHWAMRGKRSREVIDHLDAALARVVAALQDPDPRLTEQESRP